jgi:hypothetical protein
MLWKTALFVGMKSAFIIERGGIIGTLSSYHAAGNYSIYHALKTISKKIAA